MHVRVELRNEEEEDGTQLRKEVYGHTCKHTWIHTFTHTLIEFRNEEEEDDMQHRKRDEANLLHAWSKMEQEEGNIDKTR
jgi:hypothetical protein